jgi:hypothetical protein
MNTEEDEFKRIEAEALRLWAAQTDDDDDTQVYAKPWVGLTIEEIETTWSQLGRDINQMKLASDDRPQKETIIFLFARAIEAALRSKNA